MTEKAAAQLIAGACGAAMYERDYAAQALGMRLEEIRPGYARMTMTVRRDMVNGAWFKKGLFRVTQT